VRGILKSASGNPVTDLRGFYLDGGPQRLWDNRVEITLLIDDPTDAEVKRLVADVGRGYYNLEREG
jgi:hypothetical protein